MFDHKIQQSFSIVHLYIAGKLNDTSTLRESKFTKGAKVMLIGSTVTDVMAVAAPDMKALKEEMAKEEASSKEPLSKQKVSYRVYVKKQYRFHFFYIHTLNNIKL